MLPGMCDLRVRVSYFEANLRVRVSYFGLTYESESAILRLTYESESAILDDKKPPTSQSQLFCRATYESESAILQGHLRGRRCRLKSIQLQVACLAACGGEGMLLRKCRHVWHRSSPRDGLTLSLRVRVRCFPS